MKRKGPRPLRPESVVQNAIEAELGAEPDLLLLRNSTGLAEHFTKETGKAWRVPYGLGKGSPDLVGLLRVNVSVFMATGPHLHTVSAAVWIAWEVKAPGGESEPHQLECHRVWSSFGAYVATVDSVEAARAHLATVRRIFQ